MTKIFKELKFKGRSILNDVILEEGIDETDHFEFELSNGLYDLNVFGETYRLIILLSSDLSVSQRSRVEAVLSIEG